jgi:hypothetical protein
MAVGVDFGGDIGDAVVGFEDSGLGVRFFLDVDGDGVCFICGCLAFLFGV